MGCTQICLTTFINILELFYRLLAAERAKRVTRSSVVGSVTRLRAGRPGIYISV